MTGWDLLTWGAVAVLGPGAVVVFVAFLRDLARPGSSEPPPGSPHDGSDRSR
jgi:hypothetical protein